MHEIQLATKRNLLEIEGDITSLMKKAKGEPIYRRGSKQM